VRPKRIVSGGQTGVDRGGLDAAIELGIEHGGWCPRGRRAEDGAIPDRYQLNETDSADYSARTEKNVVDSDATLIITRDEPSGGTALTIECARKHGRPLLVVDVAKMEMVAAAVRVAWFVDDYGIGTLNVAGPRGSKQPELQEQTRALLCAAFIESDDRQT